MRTTHRCLLMMLATLAFIAVPASADDVTDWNAILFQTAHAAGTSPLIMTRSSAIVQAAVFDALNGIERRYTPVHVVPNAPRGASRRAAVVQAAYGTLIKLYPPALNQLTALRDASLAAIEADAAVENSQSIARGIEWGQYVADAIWTWRSADGFTPAPPPFIGGLAVGEWRPTPLAMLPGAGPQFAYMTTWSILYPAQFRPAGPPALGSARYALDFNETGSMGSLGSTLRTADQTVAAQFWATSTSSFFWNRIAVNLGMERNTTLSENARLLALLDVAMADAGIACWEAKYHYVFWRPITAIRLADTDGNSATTADPGWTPLLITPNHPEYPSGHSTTSGAAARVLADYFGENTTFSIDSDAGVPVVAGVTRSFTSFAAALTEIKEARIFGGIHFRSACDDGQATGIAVANYVLANSLLPINGNHTGQTHD
jgi:membrane-associated phospholipid phosphatase